MTAYTLGEISVTLERIAEALEEQNRLLKSLPVIAVAMDSIADSADRLCDTFCEDEDEEHEDS